MVKVHVQGTDDLESNGAGNTSGCVIKEKKQRREKKKKDAPGRNLSRLMELGAESRDPSLSEKVWRKDFICRWKGEHYAFKTPEPILQFKKSKS